ncbi:CLUMA_CG020729, isoform A [Clunio marinus]|uniref:CLUMA_CG020729, isoform A n=1 Tax=Clunio marinus TaxID=568069 RepID=A0A1J1J5V5_9DIPT|nr:CLUMA_CG020729, isoform A [Clunio marinus]
MNYVALENKKQGETGKISFIDHVLDYTTRKGLVGEIVMKIYQFLLILHQLWVMSVTTIKELCLNVFQSLTFKKRKDLSDEIAVVVGSSQGLGRELALKLGELKATVICIDIQPYKQETVSKEITSSGGSSYYFKCNVTNRDQVEKTIYAIERDIGEVSMMFHCCSLPSARSIVNNPPPVHEIIDLSITSYFYKVLTLINHHLIHLFKQLLDAILPNMKTNSKGHIVFLTSVAAISGFTQQLALSVSQFAIQGLYESVVEELRLMKLHKIIKTTLVHIYPFIVSDKSDSNFRVPGFFGSIRADEAACHILNSVQNNESEISIPKHSLLIGRLIKILPQLHCCRNKSLNKNFKMSSSTKLKMKMYGTAPDTMPAFYKFCQKFGPLGTLMIYYCKLLMKLWQFAIAGILLIKEGFLVLFYSVVPVPQKKLTTDTVLVVGSNRILGNELAIKLGELRAKVVCVDTQPPESEKTSKLIKGLGGNACYYQCNISDRDDVIRTISTITKEVGDITMLYQCCSLPLPPTAANNPTPVGETIDLAVTSYFYLIESILPIMISNQKGHLVFIKSDATYSGINQLAIKVSQSSIESLRDHVELELAKKGADDFIKVTMVDVFPFVVNEILDGIRVPGIFGSVRSDEAAQKILDGVRHNKDLISIPFYCSYISRFVSLPKRIAIMFRTILDSNSCECN